MKKVAFVSVVLSMLFTAAIVFASGSQQSGSSSAKTYNLKIGIVVAKSDPMYKGLEKFKQLVAADTNGHVNVQIYPNSALGDTKDVQAQAKAGANVGVITDPARLAEMVPDLGILGAPYVVKTFKQSETLVKSSWWQGLENQLATKDNLRILSFNWYQGARSFLTNKPITKPSDLHNLKIRTPGAPVWQDSIRSMGAVPVAMAWSEVYPAIQQGVIDGAEAQMSAVWGARLYEVIHYIDLTQHFQLISPLVVSEKWYKRLPASYQKVLREDAFKAGDYASNMTINDSEKYIKMMEQKGVKVIRLDKQPFIKDAQAVYSELKLQSVKAKVDSIIGQ